MHGVELDSGIMADSANVADNHQHEVVSDQLGIPAPQESEPGAKVRGS
jgi:hypothetical protein